MSRVTAIIPLIPVYGKRWFIDDIERVEGHIAKAMDPQRLYNLQVSMLADTAAQDPGQIPIPDDESGLAAANANKPSSLQTAISGGTSGAIAGAGLASLLGTSTPWGAGIGAGIGLLGSLF